MNNHRELLSYFNLTELPFTKEIPVTQLHLLPSVERNLAAAQLLGIIANATLMQAFTARSPQVEAEHVQQVIQR